MRKLLLTGITFLFSFFLMAQDDSEKLKENISIAADKIESKCIGWRRDIHEHPELGNQEFRTAKIIADHLRKLGIEVKEKVAVKNMVSSENPFSSFPEFAAPKI